jgi:tripartite-type tricarboxylate transporter receptor subunit TctC
MKCSRFVVILLLVTCAFVLEVPCSRAQHYPDRPIQVIIPIPAGGGGDLTGRLLAEEMGKIMGTQVIVVNKAGGGTLLGTDAVAKSKKDGYTLGYVGAAAVVYASILNPENVPYDPVNDLDPLALHVYFPLAIAVQESAPWKTFSEFIDYARKNPGKIRISTTGIGSPPHFNLEIIQSLAGVEFTHVPFKGGESVITALLGGHVEATCDTIGKIVPHVEGGKLRLLLVSKKSPQFPKVPTMTDLGYKQELLSSWFGLFAPAGLPENVKKILAPAIEKAIRNPETKAKIERIEGFIVDYKSPEEYKKILSEDYERGLAIAKKIGLRK